MRGLRELRSFAARLGQSGRGQRSWHSVIERLECRAMLTVEVTPAGGVIITGTPGDDGIDVMEDSGLLLISDNSMFTAIPSFNVTSLVINSLGGNDQIGIDKNITPTVGIPTTVNAGAGNDTVTLGTFLGTLNAVRGPVTVNGGSGDDALVLWDYFTAGSPGVVRTYNFVDSTFTRDPFTFVTFRNTETVDLATTISGSVVNIDSVPNGVDINVNTFGLGGVGDDVYNIAPFSQNLNDIRGQVFLAGRGGFNTLTVNDQADRHPDAGTVITEEAVVRFGRPIVVYSGIDGTIQQFTYNGSERSETIQIAGVAAGTALTVNANGGNDLVFTNSSVVDGVTLNGNAGNDIVIGGSGDDLITGGNGNDILVGGLGVDTLFGGGGSDALFGLDGIPNDLLDGGSGFDVLGSADPGDIIVNIP